MIKSKLNQVIFCSIGSTIEWYDFSVFAVLSPIISKVFFTNQTHFDAMLYIFMVFASGYLMRPVGAIFFGYIGDNFGRKIAMMSTIWLMAFSTFLIALIPTGKEYSVSLLVIFRLLQGFSASGEYAGGIVLLFETITHKYKNFFTSFSISSVIIAIFLGSAIASITALIAGKEIMLDYGWRFPFLFALPLGLIGYWLRKKLSDSLVFSVAERGKARVPLLSLLFDHPKKLLALSLVYIYANIAFYINFMYLTNYTVSIEKVTGHEALILNLLITLAYGLAIMFFGFISDLWNGHKLMVLACIVSLVSAYPLFVGVLNHGFMLQVFSQIMLSILLGMFAGSLAYLSARTFETDIRYTGVAFCLNVIPAFIGSTTPIIAAFIVKFTNHPIATVSLYIFSCFISFIGARMLKAEGITS